MHTIRRMPLLIVLSLVVRLLPVDLAVSAPAEPPSRGASERLHSTATPPPLQEQDGPLLLLRVRALVPDKVKLSDPAQRTVRATVLAHRCGEQPGQGPDGRGATARAVPPARDPGAPTARHAVPTPGRPAVDAGRRTSTSAGGALLVRHMARVRLRGVRGAWATSPSSPDRERHSGRGASQAFPAAKSALGARRRCSARSTHARDSPHGARHPCTP